MNAVQQVIEAGYEYLKADPKHWIEGAFGCDSNGRTVGFDDLQRNQPMSVCAVGAIGMQRVDPIIIKHALKELNKTSGVLFGKHVQGVNDNCLGTKGTNYKNVLYVFKVTLERLANAEREHPPVDVGAEAVVPEIIKELVAA